MKKYRSDFPQLQTSNVYLDSAATSLKPKIFTDAIHAHYLNEVSNVHRGVHRLSQLATNAFEECRSSLAKFINAKDASEIIFTKGTTESVNLLTSSLPKFIEGDEIMATIMDHHSNFVPWQMIPKATFKVCPVNTKGELDLTFLEKNLNEKTRIVTLPHVSNTLGTINPIHEIILLARKKSPQALICIDAAQSLSHQKIDVVDLDIDFLYFSAHKLLGPNGVGVLYGKKHLLESLSPYQYGGAMISEVTLEKTTMAALPYRLEAGTPCIAEVISWKNSIDYLDRVLSHSQFHQHENELLTALTESIQEINGSTIYGQAKNKCGVVSFNIKNIHPHDLGSLLSEQGIAIRTGHMCTQPLLTFYQTPYLCRASFLFYNNLEDIYQFKLALNKAIKLLLG